MATPGFQVYQDKENVSSIGNLPKARNRHGMAPVAKLFGASHGKNDFRTPVRKALGSVNREPNIATPTFIPNQKNGVSSGFRKPGSKGFGPTPIKRQPLSCKPVDVQRPSEQLVKNLKLKNSFIEVCKPKIKQKVLASEDLANKVQEEDDEIETMFITKKEQDDFEDIWPKKERPTYYLDALINWRPPCFGDGEEEEKKDEEERKAWILEDMKAVNELVLLSLEDDQPDFEVPPLEFLPPTEDIPLPDHIDDPYGWSS